MIKRVREARAWTTTFASASLIKGWLLESQGTCTREEGSTENFTRTWPCVSEAPVKGKQQVPEKHETVPAVSPFRKTQIQTTMSYSGLAHLERLTRQLLARTGSNRNPPTLPEGLTSGQSLAEMTEKNLQNQDTCDPGCPPHVHAQQEYHRQSQICG